MNAFITHFFDLNVADILALVALTFGLVEWTVSLRGTIKQIPSLQVDIRDLQRDVSRLQQVVVSLQTLIHAKILP